MITITMTVQLSLQTTGICLKHQSKDKHLVNRVFIKSTSQKDRDRRQRGAEALANIEI